MAGEDYPGPQDNRGNDPGPDLEQTEALFACLVRRSSSKPSSPCKACPRSP